MPATESTLDLLQERSRGALFDSLDATLSGLEQEEATAFIADQLDLFAEMLKVAREHITGEEAASNDAGPDDDPPAVAAALIDQANAEVEQEAAKARARHRAEREARREAAKLERASNPDTVR